MHRVCMLLNQNMLGNIFADKTCHEDVRGIFFVFMIEKNLEQLSIDVYVRGHMLKLSQNRVL